MITLTDLAEVIRDDMAADAARFRFIRDVLAHTVNWDGDGRAEVRIHFPKAFVPNNLLKRGNTVGEAFSLVIDAMMGIMPTIAPESAEPPRSGMSTEQHASMPEPIASFRDTNQTRANFGRFPEPHRSGMSDDERELLCLVGEFARYSLLGNFSQPCPVTARLYDLLERIKP